MRTNDEKIRIWAKVIKILCCITIIGIPVGFLMQVMMDGYADLIQDTRAIKAKLNQMPAATATAQPQIAVEDAKCCEQNTKQQKLKKFLDQGLISQEDYDQAIANN